MPLHRRILAAALLSLLALLSGCASLPDGVKRANSWAVPASEQTALGRIAISAPPLPDLTGFRLMPLGSFALDARLTLAQRAERTLDLQYYLLQNDVAGRTVMRALRDAAERGVRVRLLLDDLYTAGEDELLLGLAATPNVEIRLYNPFPAGRSSMFMRLASSIGDFGRINHRMHNKLFVADGAFAIAGGRNIADEYFGRSTVGNFIDLDALMVGAAVDELERIFDDYWNSFYVYPLDAIAHSTKTADELRAAFDAATGAAETPPPAPAYGRDVLERGPLGNDIDSGQLALTWGLAKPHADPPDKVAGILTQYGGAPMEDVVSVRFEVLEQIAKASSEVALSSPYLVPGKTGMALFSAAAARGVRVSLLTNSLASTDEPLVFMGYRRYRRQMLDAGIELYELSPEQIKEHPRFLRGLRDSIGRLHAKTAVIDRRMVFFGSMNFDPRSASVNTEMGVFVESDVLAEEMLRLISMACTQAALQVLPAADGRLQWINHAADGQPVEFPEPGADSMSLWWWNLLSPLAPEELL